MEINEEDEMNEYVEDIHKPDLSAETVQKLEKSKTSITINKHTHILLRHIKARMHITQQVTWDQLLQCLAVMFFKGKGFGIIRDSEEIRKILGEYI